MSATENSVIPESAMNIPIPTSDDEEVEDRGRTIRAPDGEALVWHYDYADKPVRERRAAYDRAVWSSESIRKNLAHSMELATTYVNKSRLSALTKSVAKLGQNLILFEVFSQQLYNVESKEETVDRTYLKLIQDVVTKERAYFNDFEAQLVTVERDLDASDRAKDMDRLKLFYRESGDSSSDSKVKLVEKLCPENKLSRDLTKLQIDKWGHRGGGAGKEAGGITNCTDAELNFPSETRNWTGVSDKKISTAYLHSINHTRYLEWCCEDRSE